MGHILWVEPVFKEMIWGGNQLKEKYGYAIPVSYTHLDVYKRQMQPTVLSVYQL